MGEDIQQHQPGRPMTADEYEAIRRKLNAEKEAKDAAIEAANKAEVAAKEAEDRRFVIIVIVFVLYVVCLYFVNSNAAAISFALRESAAEILLCSLLGLIAFAIYRTVRPTPEQKAPRPKPRG